MSKIFHVGIDIGSTTVKLVVLNRQHEIIYSKYERHYADIRKKLWEILQGAVDIIKDAKATVMITGSGGIGIARDLGVPFTQEVIASTKAIKTYYPKTDVAIELGGEDAKITYFNDGVDQRMNGTCAGGTGSFIDQMATLMKVDASGLNELARNHKVIYPIAARCGVFAKTDVQPLLERRSGKGRYCRLGAAGGCDPNDQRFGLWPADSGQHCFFRGPLVFSIGIKKKVH